MFRKDWLYLPGRWVVALLCAQGLGVMLAEVGSDTAHIMCVLL